MLVGCANEIFVEQRVRMVFLKVEKHWLMILT